MPRLHPALLALLGIATPIAFGQPATNEGPKAVPKAESAQDAEHVPTRGNTVQDKERAAPGASTTGSSRATDARRTRPKGAVVPDDAEHAPTKKTDDARETRPTGAATADDAEHAPTKKTDEERDKPSGASNAPPAPARADDQPPAPLAPFARQRR